MGRPNNPRKKTQLRRERRLSESEEIELLKQWIESGKPDSGTNPLSFTALPADAAVGRSEDGASFSPYAGCKLFKQLPVSRKTKDGLKARFTEMSEVQRASLPHSLCGRDVLGAAKTGSGKTLAFIIPVVEKLYRARWGPEDGVGGIIISPTKELAAQLFDVLKIVGKYHTLSAGLLIGGRKDVDEEKARVNSLNILVCTPGRLLQHMDETPNFDCSQLQILVLDEADRILDEGFKKDLDAIISQLPRRRQTLLFSATQTKSVRDLARLSLKDPEYISVHAEALTATPEHLKQIAMELSLGQKLDMLWSFVKAHLNSKILVFLSTCKQVKFVFEVFKKLRPGIPLKCLHGRMKQDVRMAVYTQFCEQRSILFSTDVASRGLDFPSVDWVIQVDCPEDIATYIHRVGRTARFSSKGKSVLFILPSERQMITKLQATEPKIPIQLRKANMQKLQPVSDTLAAQLAKFPNLQELAQKAFIRYCRSIYKQKDKEVFDVFKLPLDEYAASLGLAVTPKIRLLSKKMKGQKASEEVGNDHEKLIKSDLKVVSKGKMFTDKYKEDEDNDIFLTKSVPLDDGKTQTAIPPTRVSKKKKLKININRPIGTRFVFDEEGNTQPPLAALANKDECQEGLFSEQVEERYKKMREEMKQRDKEDKLLQKKRLRDARTKEKTKIKKWREKEEQDDEDASGSDSENRKDNSKKSKIYFGSDGDNESKENNVADITMKSVSIAEQECLALKLLSSMHS